MCPTGIDIRNGTQLECINCTACIDACDSMMEKVNLPKGLIRFASEESIAENKEHKYSSRAKAYTAVLGVLLIIMGFLLSERPILDATILRATGMTYVEKDSKIANLYNYKVLNKSAHPQEFAIKLISPENGEIEFVGTPATSIEVGKLGEGAFFVKINPEDLSSSLTEIEIGIYTGDELVETVKTNFNGPRKRTK